MDKKHYTVRRLRNTTEDRTILEEFDKKLSDFEKTLNDRLIEDKHIVYNNVAHVFESGECAAFITEYEGVPVAYIVGKLKRSLPWYKNEKFGYIESMFVDEGHRAHGVASELFNLLKLWFVENGIDTLELRLFSNNEKAIRLYEKWGFKPHVTEMVYKIEK